MLDSADAVGNFSPTASWRNLRLRADLLKRTRAFFDERGFLEVETPLLSQESVIDRHLDPIPATLFTDPRVPYQGELRWLQTSPEFGMKRLLAAGGPSMYQITRAFRGGAEIGPLHNPEFTMLEWYGLGDDYAAGMQLLSDLAEALLNRGSASRLTYQQAFQRFAKVDPFTASEDTLRAALGSASDNASAHYSRDVLLDLLLTRHVEPRLGQGQPTILYDYPADQAALAELRSDGVQMVAERFELYVEGVELANGYHELLDPSTLQQRNAENNALRERDGKYVLPPTTRLFNAMQHGLPRCAGCALGFDRLVMLAAGATTIAEVLAFPHPVA